MAWQWGRCKKLSPEKGREEKKNAFSMHAGPVNRTWDLSHDREGSVAALTVVA